MMTTLDSDIKAAYEWFLRFIDPREWERRKEAIEEYLSTTLEPRRDQKEPLKLLPISINDDRMGWYLYLLETYLYANEKYEPVQGSRVIPLFKRLGADIQLLPRISGLKERASELLSTKRAQPDSGLFEILTALMYMRNGWPQVELLPEAPPEKRPDIHAANDEMEYFIECKRMAKSSDYSQGEREKWLQMWRPLATALYENQLSFVLDIIFHVELESLPDTFLTEELVGKLRLAVPPCNLISDNTWVVSVRNVDLKSAREHLARNYVKYPSDQVNELIGGRRDPERGFSSIVLGGIVQLGGGRGNNYFLESMEFAAGAYWSCDAERAIERKARDIRAHLAEAVEQLPEKHPGIIHVGLETLDGGLVERERFERIVKTVFDFDARGKDLRWIYCHLFQSYSPPDKAWVIDETVYPFQNTTTRSDPPLRNVLMTFQENGEVRKGVHWMH